LIGDFVKLPMLNNVSTFQLNVLEFIFRQPTPVNIQYAMKQVNPRFQNCTNKNKDFNREYIRLYRLLKRLEKDGFVELFKMDGLIWVKPKDANILDLIKGDLQNSNFAKQKTKSPLIPKRCNKHRKEAIEISLTKQMLDETKRKKITQCFNSYINELKYKKIVLKRFYDAPTFYSKFLVIPYKTRFNDKRYSRKQFKVHNEIFKIASSKYKNAVLLTLTTDPKRFKSVFHGWKNFSKALNRFMSFLRKRLKERPLYSAYYEFTKSGLLHVHIIIFGKAYLLPKNDIVKEWERCKQGTIVDVMALLNSSGRWSSLSSNLASNQNIRNVKGYLGKYLSKSLYDAEQLELYFTSNKRFISYSYRLYRPEAPQRESLGVFYFLCSCFEWELPLVVYEEEAENVRWTDELLTPFNFL